MEHNAKNGGHKILKSCQLPLTGKNCVDLIITELAVFEVDATQGLKLIEFAEGVSVEEIKSKTGAPFKISDNLRPMQQ
jgi:3-oxoacid CoA-transferase